MKKHGWIVQSADTGSYINAPKRVFRHLLYSYDLKKAYVFATRTSARIEKGDWERVRKVSIDIDRKIIEIIPGR